jgi:MtrB/PioB family decaheme-associated outer membrane protein
MRTFTSLLAAALISTSATAFAQDDTAGANPSGFIDFGVRGSHITGDGARYERYRDLGDGLFLDRARWRGDRRGWAIDLGLDHAARRDQRIDAAANLPGKLKLNFRWDEIPMLMTRSARTFFTTASPGVLVVDDGIQSQVQASAAVLSGLFASNAHALEISSFRHIARGGIQYLATPDLTFSATVQRTRREGSLPFGGSFGHSSLVETPAPIDHTLVDVDAGAEYAHGPVVVRAGYTASTFHNDVTSMTFDSPFRITDTTSASSRGRIALAPSNSLMTVNGLASVRLPGRTRITGTVALGSLEDASNTAILPHTVNTALPVIGLERPNVDGKARTTAGTLTLTSRPTRLIDFDVRYRGYQYDNQTPEFTITQRVGYDNAVSTLAAPKETEPFGLTRHTLDADVRFNIPQAGAVGFGASRNVEDRTHRIFESTSENGVRLSYDLPSYRVVTLRAKFEHTQKRGKGDLAAIQEELSSVGEQPGMRHFDIASRDRNRATLIGSVLATPSVGLTFSVAAGKDDYIESLFGLRDNAHKVYSAGLDATPGEHVTLGASYEYERDKALSRSRQANPGAQFTDPSRNWAADGTDRTHSAMVNLGLVKLAAKFDVQVSYDYNRARSLYAYITGAVPDRTLPEEVVVDSTLPTPSQLPLVKSDLQRGTLDATYSITPRVGIGFSYWYEAYRVSDFTLDADANPDLARGQALLIGYLYRPYTAHTAWGRLVLRW